MLTEGTLLRFLKENPNPALGLDGSRLSATANVPAEPVENALFEEVLQVTPPSADVELSHIRLSHPGRGLGVRHLQALVTALLFLIFFFSVFAQVIDAMGGVHESPVKSSGRKSAPTTPGGKKKK